MVEQDDNSDSYNNIDYEDFLEEQYRQRQEELEWEEEYPIYDGDGLTDSQKTWNDAVNAAEELFENLDDDYDDYDSEEDLQSTADNLKRYYVIKNNNTGEAKIVYDTWDNIDKNYRNRAGILPPKKITAEEAEKYLKKNN